MAIPKDIRARILQQLSEIESDENVQILFAIESGSRAWGFPSPDSDYDVRFVYIRQAQDYIRLTPMRDVIERPIDAELDISGWDIQKALNLLLKPNPVLLEWLQSPIQYIWDKKTCDQLLNLVQKITHKPACSYHYLHLGESNWRRNIEGKNHFKLKKYFYVLRPAMALKFLSRNPNDLPPMKFQDLMDGVELPMNVKEVILNLIKEKSKASESHLSQPIAILDEFVIYEFKQAHERLKTLKKPNENYWDDANKLFQSLIITQDWNTPNILQQSLKSIHHDHRHS